MRDHLAALMALVPPDIPVFDTHVPDLPPQRYVVFRAPLFGEVSETLGYRPDVDDYFKVMACGLSAHQARNVQEAVRTALHRASPDVDGYLAHVTHRSTGDVDFDTSMKPHIFHTTDLYRYRATPA